MKSIDRSKSLTEDSLDDSSIQALLAPAVFRDGRAALHSLGRLSGFLDGGPHNGQFIPHLLHALSGAGNPDRVLVNLDRYCARLPDPASFLHHLANNPRSVEILVALFDGSQFLAEILLQHPDYFERLVETRRLAAPKSVEQFYAEGSEALNPFASSAEKLDALRRFQRWELLRIGACDLLDLYDLPAVTRQLSNLADSLVRTCLKIAAEEAGTAPDALIVLGMGKLGGRELNYSSDIDLLFLASSKADPASPQAALKLGERLIDALARATDEGFLYRVDMRLRPWGMVGPLVPSAKSYLAYLKKDARLWEKQALLKARVIAGDAAAGKTVLNAARPLIFGVTYEQLRAEVFGMKQQTEAQLRLNRRDWGEVKLGEGSIRDVEFTVQFLQLAYGLTQPEILNANTLNALSRLSSYRLIGVEDARILTEGYIFLRTIEHFLQMMNYRQEHRLPQEPQALAHLARRLGFLGDEPGERFLARYHQQSLSIRSIFLRYVGSAKMDSVPEPSSLPDETARHLT